MERGEEGRSIGQSKVWFPGLVDFLDADVIGSDPTHDIAVLKVSSKQYNPPLSNPLKLIPKSIPKGTSRFLQVGQTCLALGLPHGHSDTLTVGVVSALNRDVRLEGREGVIGCIQTDGMFSFVLSRTFQ